jgi:hypothetical protein
MPAFVLGSSAQLSSRKMAIAGSVFHAELPNLCASFGFVVVDKTIQIIYSG